MSSPLERIRIRNEQRRGGTRGSRNARGLLQERIQKLRLGIDANEIVYDVAELECDSDRPPLYSCTLSVCSMDTPYYAENQSSRKQAIEEVARQGLKDWERFRRYLIEWFAVDETKACAVLGSGTGTGVGAGPWTLPDHYHSIASNGSSNDDTSDHEWQPLSTSSSIQPIMICDNEDAAVLYQVNVLLMQAMQCLEQAMSHHTYRWQSAPVPHHDSRFVRAVPDPTQFWLAWTTPSSSSSQEYFSDHGGGADSSSDELVFAERVAEGVAEASLKDSSDSIPPTDGSDYH